LYRSLRERYRSWGFVFNFAWLLRTENQLLAFSDRQIMLDSLSSSKHRINMLEVENVLAYPSFKLIIKSEQNQPNPITHQ
jgi:hypothetical protein